MAQKKWYVSKVCYCEHVGHEIALGNAGSSSVRIPA